MTRQEEIMQAAEAFDKDTRPQQIRDYVNELDLREVWGIVNTYGSKDFELKESKEDGTWDATVREAAAEALFAHLNQ